MRKSLIHNLIKSTKWLDYRRISEKIYLFKIGKNEQDVTWRREWWYVIYSDDKKFKWDDPHIWDGYWHDLQKQRRWLEKRINDWRSVMIWAAIQYERCTDLVFLVLSRTHSHISVHLSITFNFWYRINKGNASFFRMITLRFQPRISPEARFLLKVSNCLNGWWASRPPIEYNWGLLAWQTYLTQKCTIQHLNWW